MIAEIFLRKIDDEYLQMVKHQAGSLLQLTPETLMNALETIKERLSDTERIFEADLQPWTDPQTILENARESLLIRNLQALKEVEELRTDTINMEMRFSHLEETHSHDALTGTLTRA